MANSVCDISLTNSPLGLPPDVLIAAKGATVDFWGVVRELEDDRKIEAIAYDANAAMAEHQLRVIGEEAAARFPLLRVMIHHRTGVVPVGEASLLVRVQTSHRAAAFDASKWIVDELKRRVPIWKAPIFAHEKGDEKTADQAKMESARS